MKTLIIGSGGREHAIAWALRRANRDLKIYATPGNAGISEVAQCVPIGVAEREALVHFAASESVELTVVGPEGPLAEGLVNEFESKGLVIFGPVRAAARLESSKSFAKHFMVRHNIPTARFKVAESAEDALEVLRRGVFGSGDSAIVVKADGLAAGKGVVVAESCAAAQQAVIDLSNQGLAGVNGKPFVFEEVLRGSEASVLVFTDGRDYVVMPPARDHKRIGENETGPNTGGMGSITDYSVIDELTLDRVRREILEPTIEGANEEGFPFKGVLFVGLMLTSEGPKVLEYNIRFGDPETQAILMRLQSNLLTIFEATLQGVLGKSRIEWSRGSSACVVLANRGYPGRYEHGAVIEGLPDMNLDGPVQVFHAGTERSKRGRFLAAGGRVLGITATGVSLTEALARCYSTVENIHWEGMQYRRDIGRFG